MRTGSRSGMVAVALIGVIATVAIIAMIMLPLFTTKLTIKSYLTVEYKYNNGEMMMLELMSYPEIRRGLGLYASGVSDNGESSSDAFNKDDIENEVASVLDGLVPQGGCYALYYDTQPYSLSDSGWILITMRAKASDGTVCEEDDMLRVSKTFLPMPESSQQVMLVLKTM